MPPCAGGTPLAPGWFQLGRQLAVAPGLPPHPPASGQSPPQAPEVAEELRPGHGGEEGPGPEAQLPQGRAGREGDHVGPARPRVRAEVEAHVAEHVQRCGAPRHLVAGGEEKTDGEASFRKDNVGGEGLR